MLSEHHKKERKGGAYLDDRDTRREEGEAEDSKDEAAHAIVADAGESRRQTFGVGVDGLSGKVGGFRVAPGG